jgi:hypothetical protein
MMKNHFISRKNTSIEIAIPGKTRVILIGKDYSVMTADPVWGSSYQCVGTVEKITRSTGFPIIVKWDNGACSAYKAVDLQIYYGKEMKSNPNLDFKCIKRSKQNETLM